MGRSGVLPRETVDAILSGADDKSAESDIIDAEIVEIEEIQDEQ